MAFIPASDTARVSMHFTQDLQNVENQFYVQNNVAWDATNLAALAASVKAWWNTYIQPNVAATLTLREIVCKDMTTSTGTEIVYTSGLPASGSNAGVAMPNSITAAIKLLTALGGRSFRGRQFILGLVQGELGADENTLTSTAMSAFGTAYNALIASIEADYTPGVVIASFVSGGIPRVTATLTKVVSAAFADNVLDNQRRRLPGRGR